MGFKWNTNTLLDGLERLTDNQKEAFEKYAATKAMEIEGWMKENRKWTDRTGAAKLRLTTTSTPITDGKITITLAHGVDYGIWLELANEKNFAIIAPAIKHFAPEIMKELEILVSKMGRRAA
jgi:hypothetical protein